MRPLSNLALAGILGLGGLGCVPVRHVRGPARPRPGAQVGLASWYGERHHGRPTASGEPFDMQELTAAHRWLPLGSWARVTNLQNGRSVVVRINDRGPYRSGRIIDLSRAAAERLGMLDRGVVRVEVQPVAAAAAQP